MTPVSAARREEVVGALRRGTVPHSGLDLFAVGLERFENALDKQLHNVTTGGAEFKAVRGEYGSGKTFFVRWLGERAKRANFAVTEIQISETETPLHRLETVYRRLMERLSTADTPQGALRNIIDGWFFALEEDALAEGQVNPNDQQALLTRTNELLEQRLAKVTSTAPTFSAALRGFREAQSTGDRAAAEGILAWLAGQPNVAAAWRMTAMARGSVRWRSRNATGSAPAAAASSSMNSSLAVVFAIPPRLRRLPGRSGGVSTQWTVTRLFGKA